jgi:hypothetical protein
VLHFALVTLPWFENNPSLETKMKIPVTICKNSRAVFVSGYPRHNTENIEVEVVSFISHRAGGAMVHPQRGWRKLRDNFCHWVSSLSLTPSPWSDILAFEQSEKEPLGAAWARFPRLSKICPGMPLPMKCPCTSFAWV